MIHFLTLFRRLVPVLGIPALLLAFACTASARTNELFVTSVVMDTDQHVELNPGDPIRYTVTYGREAPADNQEHSNQTPVFYDVYLSTDGKPDNPNNFLLQGFSDSFPRNRIGEVRTVTYINRLPANFTGTYFLIAYITGPKVGDLINDYPDVFTTGSSRVTIRPVDSPTLARVSNDSAGTDANELSDSPSITADGRYVVFESEATDIVQAPVAIAGVSQIYLKDMITGEVKMISQLGGQAGNAESKYPVISVNGELDPIAGTPRYYVAFQSAATNLVSGTGATDVNQQTDIFLYNLSTGVNTLVSVPTGAPAGQQGNGGSFLPSISGDGSLVAFESRASNLLGKGTNGVNLDTNGRSDVFVYNRLTNVVTAASATATGVLGNADSTQTRISEDGSTVVFRSYAGNLAVGVAAQLPSSVILAKTLSVGTSLGALNRISVIREPLGSTTASYTALNRDAFDPAVSRDGRFVAFATRATNTTAPNGDANLGGYSQVYVVNRAVTEPVAGLTPADYDQVGNRSELSVVSVGVSPLSPLFGFANNESLAPVISGNGRYIGFRTEASDLLPVNVIRSDGRVFQTRSTGVSFVFPENTGVLIDTPLVTIEDTTGAGSNAAAHAVILDGSIVSIVVDNPGEGYSTEADAVTVTISGGGGGGASATATVGTGDDEGKIMSIAVDNGGFGFARATASFVGGVGAGAVANAVLDDAGGVRDVVVDETGFGYTLSQTTIDFSAPDDPLGVKPLAVPVVENGRIYDIVIISSGSGYSSVPTVSITSVPAIYPEAEVYLANGAIDSITIIDEGAGYISEPIVYISVQDSTGETVYPDPSDPTLPQHIVFLNTDFLGGEFLGLQGNSIFGYADFNSASDVYIKDTGIKSIIVTEGGTGYTDSFLIGQAEITGGGGSMAQGQVIVENGAVSRIDLINAGAGYLSEPVITLPAPAGGGVQAVARAVLVEGSDRVSINHFGEETNGLARAGTSVGFEVPNSRNLAMSSNGRYMLFVSEAANSAGFIFGKSNQLPLDDNQKRDVFIIDRKIDEAVTPVRGTAPTVSLTVDTRDLTFNSTRVISATAFDGGDVVIGSSGEQTAVDGVIRKIEIYANNRLISTNSGLGTTSSLVLDTTWTAPQVAGPAQIYAVVTDGNGNRAFSATSIVQVLAPVSQRPSVTLSSNFTTISVGNSVTLQATVSDPESQIAYVSFYSNGLLLFRDIGAPFEYVYSPTASAEYKLTAVVVDGAVLTDENGNVIGGGVANDALSNELTLRVLPPPSPTVNITSPTAAISAASVNQPVFLELTATTTNPNASISTVTIKDNGTVLPGTATRSGVSSTYRYTWTPTTAGVHTIVAVATDSQQGSSDSTPRQFNVSGVLGISPTVSITNPASGSGPILTQNTVIFQITAADADGTVSSVALYGNGSFLGSAVFNAASGFWEIAVDASLLQTGLYDFVAIATDSSGNLVGSVPRSLLVATSAPVATILAPTVPSGSTVVDAKRGQPLPILIEAKSQDVLSRISSVVLSVDGIVIGNALQIGNTDEYSITWIPDTTGVFKLVATASDTKSGSVQTLDLSVRVTEPLGSAPVVALVAPQENDIIEIGEDEVEVFRVTNRSVFLLGASAVDPDGSVSNVEFFVGGKAIARVTEEPYTTTYDTSSLAPGFYLVEAIATDNMGNRTASDAVVMLVSAAMGPTFDSVTLVTTGASRRGQVGNFSVTGVHPTGTISSVLFLVNGFPFADDEDEEGEDQNPVTSAPFSTSRIYDVAGTLSFSALVTDNFGNTALTNTIIQTVVNNSPPTVRLTYPVSSSSSLTLGGSINLEAEAVAPDAGDIITDVAFFANGVEISPAGEEGEEDPLVTHVVGTNLWRFTWTPEVAGTYVITAQAVSRGGVSEGNGNSPLVATSTGVTVKVNTVATSDASSAIGLAYQLVFNRAPTTAEIVSAVSLYGEDVTTPELITQLLQTTGFRDGEAELLLSYLAVFGRYPTPDEFAEVRAQQVAGLSDAQIVQALLDSPDYQALYGDVADLLQATTNQYNLVRAFALRSYTNLNGKTATGATANTVAQQFFTIISGETETEGEAGEVTAVALALINYVNNNYDGGKNGTLLARLRVAGAILFIEGEAPERASVNALAKYSLRAVVEQLYADEIFYAAGGLVEISTAAGNEPAGTTFYVSGLPKSLEINHNTGVISGQLPASIKIYSFKVWSQTPSGVRSTASQRLLLVGALPDKFVGGVEALLRDESDDVAGKITYKVTSSASYTGKIMYRDGKTYSFKGILGMQGGDAETATAIGVGANSSLIKRSSPLLPLDLTITYDDTGAVTIGIAEGEDADPVVTAVDEDVIKVTAYTKSAPAPWRGVTNVNILEGDEDGEGDDGLFNDGAAGSGTLKVAVSGVVSVRIRGGDNALITGTAGSSASSQYRFYARPYAKKPTGYFAGSLTLADEETPATIDLPEAEFSWFRPEGMAPANYFDGFGPISVSLGVAE